MKTRKITSPSSFESSLATNPSGKELEGDITDL